MGGRLALQQLQLNQLQTTRKLNIKFILKDKNMNVSVNPNNIILIMEVFKAHRIHFDTMHVSYKFQRLPTISPSKDQEKEGFPPPSSHKMQPKRSKTFPVENNQLV
jgi:hypothetical protein